MKDHLTLKTDAEKETPPSKKQLLIVFEKYFNVYIILWYFDSLSILNGQLSIFWVLFVIYLDKIV